MSRLATAGTAIMSVNRLMSSALRMARWFSSAVCDASTAMKWKLRRPPAGMSLAVDLRSMSRRSLLDHPVSQLLGDDAGVQSACMMFGIEIKHSPDREPDKRGTKSGLPSGGRAWANGPVWRRPCG